LIGAYFLWIDKILESLFHGRWKITRMEVAFLYTFYLSGFP
jgi:hypothetical protein